MFLHPLLVIAWALIDRVALFLQGLLVKCHGCIELDDSGFTEGRAIGWRDVGMWAVKLLMGKAFRHLLVLARSCNRITLVFTWNVTHLQTILYSIWEDQIMSTHRLRVTSAPNITLEWQFGVLLIFQFLLLTGNSEYKHWPLLVSWNRYQGSFDAWYFHCRILLNVFFHTLCLRSYND